MNTVLIVEDEKMIRQGIRTMIQRSGVPVDMIMECNNGLMAMDILKSQKIDVMFTDIRMPKMDGIELVKAMQELEHIPFTIVISGYDDFSYAVEMLRMGVKEYILKPVDREKIKEVLEKMEIEVQKRNIADKKAQSIELQQLKYIIMNDNIKETEMELLLSELSHQFLETDYYVCCINAMGKESKLENKYIFLGNVEESDLYLVGPKLLEELKRSDFVDNYVGISKEHNGLTELREAYIEAKEAREEAFWMNKNLVLYSQNKKQYERQEDIESNSIVQMVQMLGTDKYSEAITGLEKLFKGARAGNYAPVDMEKALLLFLEQIQKVYQNVVKTEQMEVEQLLKIYSHKCEKQLREKLMAWLDKFCQTINSQFDDYKNKQKIQQAILFIQENYDKDLNMAVVSNHISMNYSLFSYVFKQYTGSNFVNYLKEIRIKEAKRLLEETDMRVVEISQSVGYENEKHFMKIFKSVCGVSPTEYRKNMQFKES